MGYSDEKPPCYGDKDYYDPDHEDCNDCAVFQSCGIRAARSARSDKPSKYSTPRTAQHYPPSTVSKKNTQKQIQIIEPDDDITYGKLLLHNTGLEVVQAIVDEISNSVRHIPRLDYGKYFDRRKK